jgi:hypothetical protein
MTLLVNYFSFKIFFSSHTVDNLAFFIFSYCILTKFYTFFFFFTQANLFFSIDLLFKSYLSLNYFKIGSL